MTINRFVSVTLMASLLIAALPTITLAKEDGTSSTSVDLRAAVDRAAVQLMTASREPSAAVRISRPVVNAARQSSGGGGGGKGMMIWTLVGTLGSVATAYYVMKEMKKQTNQLQQQ
jgi:hypothetical protein